ncbi:MAG: hypothetical protein ABEJ94_08715 [Halorientalis sp.]
MDATPQRTPVDRLVDRFGGASPVEGVPVVDDPIVLYAIVVVFCELVLNQTVRYLLGYGYFFVANPLWLLRPITLVGAAMATRLLHDRYATAVEEMNLFERAENPDQFERLTAPRLTVGIVLAGVGFTLANAVFVIGLPALYAAGGVADLVQFLVIIPFGYAPIFGVFLSTYLGVEILLPRRIAASDLGLYYHDPENLGGMRPVGELVKLAYYTLIAGLILYAVALYGPYLLRDYLAWAVAPSRIANVLFTGVWIVTLGTMVYGLHTLHTFMRRQKREKIQQLDAAAREIVDRPWDIEQFELPDESQERYDDLRSRMDLVSATKEYPATFTMWFQLAIGVIAPKAIQLILYSL